jgi:hypothetical protein
MNRFRGPLSRRTSLLTTLLAAMSLVFASPAAAYHSVFLPADENGCGVDLLAEATHRDQAGDRFPIAYGDITFTNLETGATYLQRSRYTATEEFDASTGSWHITIIGRVWLQLYPGDLGPSGVVQEPGLELLTSGNLEFTIDSNDAIIAFVLHGTSTDLCEQLTH